MTSKERFHLTVNHKQHERMVVDFGSASITGILKLQYKIKTQFRLCLKKL